MCKLFHFDLETTGTDHRKHGLHQLGIIIEINGVVKSEIDLRVAPHPKAIIEPEALKVAKIDETDLMLYQPMHEGFKEFLCILDHYVDRYDPKDKFYQVGYNNRAFDDVFLRAWFAHNGHKMPGSYFWSDSLDVMVLSSYYLMGERRRNMPRFNLLSVARELGIPVDTDRAHDALYDVRLTRQIYNYITGNWPHRV